MLRHHPLDTFMDPKSVAVIGVSRKTGQGSFNLIENMMAFGYEGKIYPVNPFAQEIMGLKCHRNIEEIVDSVDLAIISTPREEIPRIVKDCARHGIKGAIVVPQGFADADADGKALQKQLTDISRKDGIRILGPNTLGVINAFSGFSSSFMPVRREKVPVGIICQSGTFFVGASIFTGMMGKGIDVANGCDLDFSDALEYFGEDDDIKVIFAHIEGLKDGRRFFDVAKKVTRIKPVIALKTARTDQGAKAASSHSGSLVGAHEVFEAAFRQAGIISAKDPEEVLDYTKAFLYLNPMKGNRVGVVTLTGAGGIILIDTLEEQGLQMAELSSETIKTVKDLSPEWMPIHNPLDIWPAIMKHGMHYVYEQALKKLLQDPSVNALICIAIAPNPPQAFLDATDVIRETVAKQSDKPVVSWLYGPNQQAVSASLEEGGHVISLPTLPRAARTLGALYRRDGFLKQTLTDAPRFKVDPRVRELLNGFKEKGSSHIQGKKAFELLQGYGIPVVHSQFVNELQGILKAAEGIGYPVALKISSPQITHKTDVGGLALNIGNHTEMESAYESMVEAVKTKSPRANIDGFLVQKMIGGGLEVILGAKRDPQFGPTILFGTGGIYTEVWKDIAYGIAPLSPEEARRMIRQTKSHEILKGVRGESGYDMDILVSCLLRLSKLMMDMEDIKEVDINPFGVFSEGGLALDAKIIL